MSFTKLKKLIVIALIAEAAERKMIEEKDTKRNNEKKGIVEFGHVHGYFDEIMNFEALLIWSILN